PSRAPAPRPRAPRIRCWSPPPISASSLYEHGRRRIRRLLSSTTRVSGAAPLGARARAQAPRWTSPPPSPPRRKGVEDALGTLDGDAVELVALVPRDL